MFVVAGVSGNTGRVVAETLLAKGAPVRVVVRDAAKGEPWKKQGAEVAVADLGDQKALARALAGSKGAYLLVPPNVTAENVFAEQQKVLDSIVAAVAEAHVPHVVFLSSIAAQLPSGTGPIRLLHGAERALSKVTDNTTFVRAAYFMENLGGSLGAVPHGILPTFMLADVAIPMIATRDIGTTAANALLEGPKGRDVIELEGPVRYSPADAAKVVSELVKKDIALQVGPEDAIVSTFMGFGFSKSMSELYLEMIHGFNVGHAKFEGSPARSVRGQTPLRDVLAPMLAQP